MDLSNLKPAEGSTKKKKRIGRGQGSGRGGHTATKGHKGQKARSGASIPAWFEGGQMPLQRRVPKFGFKNPFRVAYRPVNVGRIQEMVAAGRIDAAAVTVEAIVSCGLASKGDLIKVLGVGGTIGALQISAHGFSAGAKEKIESAGGTASIVA